MLLESSVFFVVVLFLFELLFAFSSFVGMDIGVVYLSSKYCLAVPNLGLRAKPDLFGVRIISPGWTCLPVYIYYMNR